MVIEYSRGEVADHIGCIKASERHNIVAYEDRGEDLSYLKAPSVPATTNILSLQSCSITQTGSQRLQEKIDTRKAEERKKQRPEGSESRVRHKTFMKIVSTAMHGLKDKISRTAERQSAAVLEFTKPPSPSKKYTDQQQTKRTRADKGQVSPPNLVSVTKASDLALNAFLEFLQIEKATREVNLTTCKNILQAYLWESEGLLGVRLTEAEAAIYDNERSRVIKGSMSGRYMAAFNSTAGFVALNEEETTRTGNLTFVTPSDDPIVVTARCTKIMLQEKIIEMAKTISEGSEPTAAWENWTLPKFTWINGVPGCGKTTWIVDIFDANRDIIVTTTTEAAKDLRAKVAHRIGDGVKSKVRTLASILANGFMERREKRLLIDEAHMNHFGAIIMAARLLDAEDVVIIGDVNQLPYIERENLFKIRYSNPNVLATIGQELYCTHRNPMDVAYVLREVYPGFYSSRSRVHSLKLQRYTGALIPKDLPNTLYLTLTQEEKSSLISGGYGCGQGSRILTVHEAQGLTHESVIIIQTRENVTRLRDSVPHAVVALSRHTESCTYYTDDSSDTIGGFVRRAVKATEEEICNHNLRMAIRDRNDRVVGEMTNRKRTPESVAGPSETK